METIPAIDLLGDEAVRLHRGSFAEITWRSPWREHLERVLALQPPRLHVVDLDGARTGSVRMALIDELLARAGTTPVQVGGGVRSLAAAQELIALGADRVVIGTAALTSGAALHQFVAALGARLVVAVDVRAGRVAVRGWQATAALGFGEALDRCRDAGVRRILCTAVERDGAADGPDLRLIDQACASGLAVLAAGGIRSPEQVAAVAALGCEAAILGTAMTAIASD